MIELHVNLPPSLFLSYIQKKKKKQSIKTEYFNFQGADFSGVSWKDKGNLMETIPALRKDCQEKKL